MSEFGIDFSDEPTRVCKVPRLRPLVPESERLTQTVVALELRAVGVSLSKRDGEYRVNFHDGGEATAYYTDDLADARGTGLFMARTHKTVDDYFSSL